MKVYYYNKKFLYDLLQFKKVQIDYDFTERFNITTDLINEISRNKNFGITDPKLRAVALTFLYKYIYENVSGLIHILKKRNEFNKKTLVFRKGNSKLFRIKLVKDVNLLSKEGVSYYRALFFVYYLLGIKKNKQHDLKKVIALIKRDKLSTQIWKLINDGRNNDEDIRDENFFGFLLKDNFSNDPRLRQALKELKVYKKVLGTAFYLKSKYYLISGWRFFKQNPTKNFVTFEQHTISYMVLSFLAERIGINSFSIAHAVVNADYKRHMAFDHCLLYGKSSEESFQREDSIVCGKIYRTGAPIMNKMFKNISEQTEFLSRVLFLTDYVTDFGYDIEEVHIAKNTLIKKLVRNYPEIKLTVKYHPAKINPYTESILSDLENITFKQNADILEEIDSSDIVICDGWSSSGLETVIRKRQLVLLNVKQKRKDFYKYYESGYGYNAEDEVSICNAYETIKNKSGKINEAARKELIRYHLEFEDGISNTADTFQKLIAA